MLKCSVIFLLEERHKDFAKFVHSLYEIFSRRRESFEFIIMANGTGDFLMGELEKLDGCRNAIKAFEFASKTSKAVCLKAGLRETKGEVIVVCGSYQQITSKSLERALDSLDDETSIVNPWRINRIDPRVKQFQSKMLNLLVRKIMRNDLHDIGCTVKVIRRAVLEETRIYGNIYRFLPVVAAQKGFKTKEVKCQHYYPPYQKHVFSLSSCLTSLIDIITLYFNTRFTRKPLRFFSAIGFCFLVVGLMMITCVFVQKSFLGLAIGNRPILLLSVLFMVLGVQTASVGVLGEIITFIHGRHNKEYTVEKEI